MPTFVYQVRNTLDGKLYVGVSKGDLHRLNEHRRGIKSNRLLQNAIAKHGIDNFSFEQLEEWSTCEEALDAERRVIDDYRHKGVILYNLVDGGRGSLNPGEETRQRMRDAKLGAKNHRFGMLDSEATKAKRNASLSKTLTGRRRGPHTPEARENIRRGNVGKKHRSPSDESRRLRSERMRGKPTPMTGMSPWNKGKKTGPHSPERCQAKSERQRGTKRTEETKQKMRAAAQLREVRKKFRVMAHSWFTCPRPS